jgi:hypothetical protein
MSSIGDVFTALLEGSKFNPMGNFVSRAHSNNAAFQPNVAAGPLGGFDPQKLEARDNLLARLQQMAAQMR